MKTISILISLPKFVHFLLSLLHFKIKFWNYVLEFKCSQNIWNLHTCIWNTNCKLYEMACKDHLHTIITKDFPKVLQIILQEDCQWQSMNWMLWILSSILSQSEIFCLKAVIFACSLCSYVTALRKNISLLEKTKFIMLWTFECNENTTKKPQMLWYEIFFNTYIYISLPNWVISYLHYWTWHDGMWQ